MGRNPDDGRALFVGWTPGATVMPKDMETDHDVGFLTLTPERLIYLGDTVHFELHRSQVFEVAFRQEGIPFFFDMGKRILIRIGSVLFDGYQLTLSPHFWNGHL